MSHANGRPRGAVVLAGDYRALGVVRSLGRHGVPVWVIVVPTDPIASMSRYAQCTLAWPHHASPEQRVDFLRELASERGLAQWALIPTADPSVALVAGHHAALAEHYILTTPRWETVRWAYDKRLTYELADRAGVPRPRTQRAQTPREAEAVDLTFPVAIKPAVKESDNALTLVKAWRVDERGEMAARFAAASALVKPETLLIQEVIPGGGEAQFSYAALCRDGVPLATVTARRTRQYPAQFGRASTFVETIDCTELAEPSLRLLREIRYTGLIELEYKRDPRDGTLKLLDMNARVWGWHTLCARAGVDFPWLLWLLVSGGELPACRPRPGIGWLRFATDTPTAVREMLSGRLAVRDYARSLRLPRESAIFAWDDPLPGLAEVPLLLYAMLRRLWEGRPL